MRKILFEIIEADTSNKLSAIYDAFMMITIVISIIPLAFKQSNIVFEYIDYITVAIFIIDYLLRLLTADYKLKNPLYLLFCTQLLQWH